MLCRYISTLFLVLFSQNAEAKSHNFDFTPTEFEKRLNIAIENDTPIEPKDGADIDACRAGKKNEIVCSFKDKSYQNSVAAMKKLDLLNGDFEHKLTLTLRVDAGKVSSIRLNGDRGDPANLFSFTGAVMDVFSVFDKDAVKKDDDLKDLTEDLGLMRGDSASDIGEFRTVIKPYAAVKCLAVPSSVSTGHVCVWEPRY